MTPAYYKRDLPAREESQSNFVINFILSGSVSRLPLLRQQTPLLCAFSKVSSLTIGPREVLTRGRLHEGEIFRCHQVKGGRSGNHMNRNDVGEEYLQQISRRLFARFVLKNIVYVVLNIQIETSTPREDASIRSDCAVLGTARIE